jgi:FKBP-type peptidyl-prolyl cis-trans isomerase SlyD
MTDQELTVRDGMVVSLDYTLSLDSGQVVDSSSGQAPLDFVQGSGQIIPGLEQALAGMAIGDEKAVTVDPSEGYGAVDPGAFQTFPLNAFPPDIELSPGLQLQVRDEGGRVFPVQVAEVGQESVLLDFNHPLAGENLHFQVKVVGLRPASQEEMDHGHAHSGEGGH